MKKVPITLSLPEELVRDLHHFSNRRQISKFVAKMVQKGIEEKKRKLAEQYKEASEDFERNTELELWDTADGDGLILILL